MTPELPKQILVGVDRSPASLQALREAARIARWRDAVLRVVEVVPDGLLHAHYVPCRESLDQAKERIHRELEDFVRDAIGPVPDLDVRALAGHPAATLVELAHETYVDLLVVGSAGWGTDEHELGSFASRVVRTSKVSVLVVRPRKDDLFNRVVACVDLGEGSDNVIRAAAEIARVDGAELQVVHAYRIPTMGYDVLLGALPDPEFTKEHEDLLAGHLDTLVKDNAGEVPGGCSTKLFESESIAWGMVNHIREIGADLAVVGDRRRGSIHKFLLGTNAGRIVNHSPCSVLTVKSAKASA